MKLDKRNPELWLAIMDAIVDTGHWTGLHASHPATPILLEAIFNRLLQFEVTPKHRTHCWGGKNGNGLKPVTSI